MPFPSKNNQSLIQGRDYEPVPGEETQSPFPHSRVFDNRLSHSEHVESESAASPKKEKQIAIFQGRLPRTSPVENDTEGVLRISTVSNVPEAKNSPRPKLGPNGFYKSIRSKSSKTRKMILTLFSFSSWRKMAKKFVPMLLLVIYSASGGLLFWLLEGKGRKARDDLERSIRLQKAGDARNATVTQLMQLIDQMATVKNISSQGSDEVNDLDGFNETLLINYAPYMNNILLNFTSTMLPLLEDRHRQDWTFWGSVFYCGTIYTTIGYGYMTADTKLGQALTMIYAIFGIPLVLLTLGQLGKWLMRAIWFCYINVLKLISVCRPTQYRRPSTSKKRDMAEFPFWIAISMTIGWMLMCSSIFRTWEDWDFFTSFYFFFQSLTTIGFGDVKPRHQEYLVFSFFLIFIGLALMSMCWSLLQMKFDHLISSATQKITEQFVNAEFDDGEMVQDRRAIQLEIEKITSGQNAFLSNLVSENRRQALVDEWRHRAKMRNQASQTKSRAEDKATQTTKKKSSLFDSETLDELELESHTLSPTHWDVPYKEMQRPVITATPFRRSNDEVRHLIQGLKNIIGECRETLSYKDPSVISSVINADDKKIKASRDSTDASVSMIEL